MLSDSDSESDTEELDSDEIADLLDDAARNEGIQLESGEDGDLFYVEEGSASEDDEEPEYCEEIPGDEMSIPSLAEESIVEERPQRERLPPERYNPASGRSYHQNSKCKARSAGEYDEFVKDYCDLLRERKQVHNIIADVEEVKDCLEYKDREA